MLLFLQRSHINTFAQPYSANFLHVCVCVCPMLSADGCQSELNSCPHISCSWHIFKKQSQQQILQCFGFISKYTLKHLSTDSTYFFKNNSVFACRIVLFLVSMDTKCNKIVASPQITLLGTFLTKASSQGLSSISEIQHFFMVDFKFAKWLKNYYVTAVHETVTLE